MFVLSVNAYVSWVQKAESAPEGYISTRTAVRLPDSLQVPECVGLWTPSYSDVERCRMWHSAYHNIDPPVSRRTKEVHSILKAMGSSSTIRRIQLDPQRHRFHNKAALVLTALTMLLLAVLSFVFGQDARDSTEASLSSTRNLVADDSGDVDYSGYSCRYIYEQVPDPGKEQCRFARTCNGGEGVWAPFVFCRYNAFSAMTLFTFLSPIMIIWMVTLFRLLGSTAEDYFSPSLEMFSVKLGLPPRFAGVTLLALGNGAADVSATMSAIVGDVENGYKLSLGALSGAAMLIGGVVAGVVVLAADGVPCRGALVRDVTAMFITICVVWGKLSSGKIGPETTSLFLSLYGLFVCIVLVADVYHRAVVLPRLQALQAQADGTVDESATPLDSETNPGPPSALSRVMTAISNYDNVPNNGEADGNANSGDWGIVPGTNPSQESGTSFDKDEPIILHGQHGILHGDGQGIHAPSTPTNTLDTDNGGAYALVTDEVDQFCAADGSLGFSAANWKAAFLEGKQEVIAEVEKNWEDIAFNGDLNIAEKAMMICEFPFTILRKATVAVPCDGYYNRGFIALSIAASPLWFAYYIWHGHDINLLATAHLFLLFWGLAIVFAGMVLRYAPGGEGSMAMGVAVPIALYGFIIAATWIDFVADNLVSLLDFIGILLRIPGTVMGLTVLAWGNSMADLSANVTMAKKGLANMAMTACFAGPVFNILVGLGLGFSNLAVKTGNAEAEVSLSPTIVTGFIFVLLNCTCILVAGIVIGKGRIVTKYGYVSLGLYSIYVISAVGLEFSKFGSG